MFAHFFSTLFCLYIFSIQKLAKCQATLMDVLRNELINEETGIATDKDGNSLGMVEVSKYNYNYAYDSIQCYKFYVKCSLF